MCERPYPKLPRAKRWAVRKVFLYGLLFPDAMHHSVWGTHDMPDSGFQQFIEHVRAVVIDHWSGLPEDRPSEQVWARLDAVLFDDANERRPYPCFAEALREQ